MNEPIQKVDEDWKRRAKEELLKVAAPATSAPAGKPKDRKDAPRSRGGRTPFMDFMHALATEALIFLGAMAHPQTGQAVYAPEQAKQTIDILHMLEEKTKGNLTPEEEEMLRGVLHELRMVFVDATARETPVPAPPRK